MQCVNIIKGFKHKLSRVTLTEHMPCNVNSHVLAQLQLCIILKSLMQRVGVKEVILWKPLYRIAL